MVSKQRARTGADKLARRMEILDAALGLWEEQGFDSVTMSMVADRLQLAKGTLYLYFRTKEELFLAIYIQLLDEWFNKASLAINELPSATPFAVSKALVGLLIDRPNLSRLIPLVAPLLERNISEPVGREYKEWLNDHIATLGEQIENQMNGLSPGTGNDSLIYFFAMAAGLAPMGDPTEVLKPVVDDPKLLALRVELGPALQHGLSILLTGFQRLAG